MYILIDQNRYFIDHFLFDKGIPLWYNVTNGKEIPTDKMKGRIKMLNFKNLIVRENGIFKGMSIPREFIKEMSFVNSVTTDVYVEVVKKNNMVYTIPVSEVGFDGIKVDGHIGTWYTIDKVVTQGQLYFFLEHEEYGDEAANCIIDFDGILIQDEVYDFSDLEYILEN